MTSACSSTRRVQRRGLTLVCENELAGDLPVRADAVRQAVLNLLLNACHATPPAGASG